MVRGLLTVAAASIAAGLGPAVAHAYGWPIAPFAEQHAIRGFFDDPRLHVDETGLEIGAFHFGVDISAPGGTPVYAVAPGTAYREADAVAVRDGAHEFSYWHVTPAVPEHSYVYEHELIGWVKATWGHVHFAESVDGRYVNPLRPGALEPFVDTTTPVVASIYLVGAGAVADVYDTPPIAPPPPWEDTRVTPALVRWRLLGPDAEDTTPWHVAADFRDALLAPAEFEAVYAPGTSQNKPYRPGRYLFWLSHDLSPMLSERGAYRLEVEGEDLAGNVGHGELRLEGGLGRRGR